MNNDYLTQLSEKAKRLAAHMDADHLRATGPDVRCFRYSDVADIVGHAKHLATGVLSLLAEVRRLRAGLSGLLGVVDDGHVRLGPHSPEWEKVLAARKAME